MFVILNRMAWIVSGLVGLGILSIDGDLWFWSILAVLLVKFLLLSQSFLKKNILEYSSKIENMVISYLNLSNPQTKMEESKPEEIEDESLGEELDSAEYYDTPRDPEPEELPQPQPVVSQKVPEPSLPREPSAIGVFFKNFFAENLMAKIGGILLALGIIFLMSLVYNYIGNTMKIILGFAVGFGVYWIGGVLYTKGYKNEGLTLLGSGILINYIVILGGRFFIGEAGYLSASLAFGLLVLNSAFSTVTSLVYKGKHMLLFSIFLAYVTPYLVGSSGSEWSDVTLLGYNLLITLGTFKLILSHRAPDGQNGVLLYFMVVLGNLLIALTPSPHESWSFVGKMIAFCGVNGLAVFGAYRSEFSKHIGYFLSIAYLSFFFDWQMMAGNIFTSIETTIFSLVALGGMLLGSAFFLTVIGGTIFSIILFAPLFIILLMLFSGDILGGIFILPFVVVSYMLIFVVFLSGIFSTMLRGVFFILLGIFVTLFSIHFRLEVIDTPTFVSLALTSMFVMWMTYFFSRKDQLGYLYPVGSLIGALMLLPIIQITGEFALPSAILVGIYFLANASLGFVNQKLLNENPPAMILGNIIGILMVSGHLYRFGNEYFPGVTLGMAFAGLAIVYFLAGFAIFSRLKTSKESDVGKENFLMTLLGIAVSLFSYAIALLFASLPLVIVLTWLGEAMIVAFFTKRYQNMKLLGAVMILSLIGIVKYYDLLIDGKIALFGDVVALGIMLLSLMGIIYFTKNLVYQEKYFLHVMHIFGVIGIYSGLCQIYSYQEYWLGYTLAFVVVIRLCYQLLADTYLSRAFLVSLGIVFGAHILSHGYFEPDWNNYLFTGFFVIGTLFHYFYGKDTYKNPLAYLVFVYFFIISTQYLSEASGNDFTITIYWGVLALIGIHWGISGKYPKIRAIGLVVLFLTLLKIVLYDIWNEVDQAWLRIIALLFVGGMMVYISMLYSKNKLSIRDDLSLSNQKTTIKEMVERVLVAKARTPQDLSLVDLHFADSRKISLKSTELSSLARAIIEAFGKDAFGAGELQEFYDELLKNYETTYSVADRKKLRELIKDFVEIGGRVVVVK